MAARNSFSKALKTARKARGLTQEDFSDVSSRTYLSSLERGEKSPTLGKIDALCGVMGLHPLTLLTLAYVHFASSDEIDKLLEKVRAELGSLESATSNQS
jgi:transcriptional regulator with XRE-family HTH domain